MTNNRSLLLFGFLVVVAAAGSFIYLQGRSSAEALDASPAPVVAQDVPEAASVHEGARPAIAMDRGEAVPITVYASPTCGCCSAWMDHLREHGFDVEVVHRDDMIAVKQSLEVPRELRSCHTGVVNDYVIEGHVPGDDLRRFLAEAPQVRGLTVPGMPAGSPGMEVPGGTVDPYEVLTFRADGSTAVYAEYGSPGDG